MSIRLINTSTLRLTSFFGDRIPKYAILSYTWQYDEEISFQDMIFIGKLASNATHSTTRPCKLRYL